MLEDGFEGTHVGDCELREHFSVELDSLSVQPMDQLRAIDAAVRTRSGDTNDPEATEITLLSSSVSEPILRRLGRSKETDFEFQL